MTLDMLDQLIKLEKCMASFWAHQPFLILIPANLLK